MLRRVQPGREEPIDAFVSELGGRLRARLDETYLRAILTETEGHLRQAAEEMAELGVSPREAERAAVAAYGRPRFEAPPSRLVAGLAFASGGAAFGLALTSLDDFKTGSPASLGLVAAVVGLPLLLFAALGLRGARPRLRPLVPTILAGASLLLVGLPTQFVVSARGWERQAILPQLDDPFFARYRLKTTPDDRGEASLAAPYGARLVRMAPWSIALPTPWAFLTLSAQAAGYGLGLAARTRRRRPTVA